MLGAPRAGSIATVVEFAAASGSAADASAVVRSIVPLAPAPMPDAVAVSGSTGPVAVAVGSLAEPLGRSTLGVGPAGALRLAGPVRGGLSPSWLPAELPVHGAEIVPVPTWFDAGAGSSWLRLADATSGPAAERSPGPPVVPAGETFGAFGAGSTASTGSAGSGQVVALIPAGAALGRADSWLLGRQRWTIPVGIILSREVPSG
jgi:hypothetical protein